MPEFKNREEYEQWKAEKASGGADTRKRQEEFKLLAIFMRVLSAGSVVVIVIFFLPLVVPFIGGLSSFFLIEAALIIEDSLSSLLQAIIPTQLGGIDLTRWIFITAAFFFAGWFTSMRRNFIMKSTQASFRSTFEDLKKQLHLSDDAHILAPIKEKLESDKFNKADRNELLTLFAETKKKLDMMGRDVAFLAIDVVGSTQMKVGEEKALVELDFIEYKKFVEEKIKANGSLKTAWTPDGVMICFPSVDSAVKAAQDVINGLDSFNKHVKTIKQDFSVRCGINSGYVYYDENQPMQEMSDRVIDIAGHMQKQADPDNICIAKPAVEPMTQSDGFIPSSKIVDGYEMYIWGKK